MLAVVLLYYDPTVKANKPTLIVQKFGPFPFYDLIQNQSSKVMINATI